MKKTLLLAALVVWSSTLFAAGTKKGPSTDFAPAVQKAVAKAVVSNKNAIENNLLVTFSILESMYREEENEIVYPGETLIDGRAEIGPFSALLGCKAYALDDHWLILSGTCMRYSPDPVDVYETRYTQRTGREIISDFQVKNFTIPAANHATNGNVLLLWTDAWDLSSYLNQLPKVNLLGVSSPRTLFALNADNVFKINTARFGFNTTRERSFKPNTLKGNKFELKEGITALSGTATDPLFLITPEGNEFLAGYNNGVLGYTLQLTVNDILYTWDGRPSSEYFSLTENDLEFIKQTVLGKRPDDWKNIKKRLFFNQTQTPFFK